MIRKYSMCICAYNEETNIAGLLESIINQKITSFSLEEIIVVSSSTDNTNNIVNEYILKDKRIKLIIEKEKKGKVTAINTFLKNAKNLNCILASGDIILKKDALEFLCKPLENPKIGICGGRPTPLNKKNTIVGNVVHILWEMHHYIALKNPKFGECIAFKNVFNKIPNNAVDEEYIAHLVKEHNLNGIYVPEAIIYNYGPESLKDFIIQRRRIHCGHLKLKKENSYIPASSNNGNIIKVINKLFKHNNPIFIISAIFLEAYSRLLGNLDFLKKREHTNWTIATSTKKNLKNKIN